MKLQENTGSLNLPQTVMYEKGQRACLDDKITLAPIDGRSGRIRTDDPLSPRQVRYRAALRSDKTG